MLYNVYINFGELTCYKIQFTKIILHNASPTNVIDDFKGEFSFSGILPMPFEVQMLRDYEFNLHDPLRANHAEYVKIPFNCSR